MALRMDVIGNFSPDVGVSWTKLASELSLTNVKNQFCWKFPFPTGSDLGGELQFEIPVGYASDPVLVLRGIIDGTPANTLGVYAQQLARSLSDSVDTVYETEDTASNATWTGYSNEDEYEIAITLTPSSAYTPGQTVYVRTGRDDSVDNTTWDFLVTRIMFQYTES